VNELGIEEAGIDGGGIFKDFMENIVQASFDVQYGLFKVLFFVMPFDKITSKSNLSFLFISNTSPL
jgi:hypothetical protein